MLDYEHREVSMLMVFQSLSVIVALLHIYFLILEMFLWTKPLGKKVFRMSEAQAQATKVLAQNQGLYNGFLATGLLYGVFIHEIHVIVLFLCFVIVAGIYGSLTASPKTGYVQAIPALITLTMRLFL